MVNFKLGKRYRERCFSFCPERVKKKKNKIKEMERENCRMHIKYQKRP